MSKEKTFEGVLVLNWKTGGMKIMKRGPSKVGPFEIPATTTVTMSFPVDIVLAASQDLELTADAGSVSGVVQGFIR